MRKCGLGGSVLDEDNLLTCDFQDGDFDRRGLPQLHHQVSGPSLGKRYHDMIDELLGWTGEI